MTIHLLCLGTLKENYLKDAQRDLVARLVRKNGINSCQIIEFNEEPLNEQASQGQIQSALAMEATRIREKIPKNARLICLDINGKPAKPDFFAAVRTKMQDIGQTDLVLIIGGSNGIHESLKRQAKHRISFSHLTYPHQLFRIALLEALALYL